MSSTLFHGLLRTGSRVSRNVRCITTDHSKNNAWIFSKDAGQTTGHSSLLSSKNSEVYEVISVNVNPQDWEKYLLHSERLMGHLNDGISANHLASWSYIYGDVNFRALHLIEYPNGWDDIDSTRKSLKKHESYQKELKSGLPLIRTQSNEIMKGFSFWPTPKLRSGNNVYDVRSYTVKPGSMYDWGNYWAKGIQCRMQVRPDIPYGGFFAQIGQLHKIYHIWCYEGLADRKSCRESTWNQSEWNHVVASTVPLIRSMSTRILEPLPFSPTQ